MRMRDSNVVVGAKQVKRALIKNEVESVWIAQNANYHIIKEIIELCEEMDIKIKRIEKMSKLGKMFEIDVNATSVAILKTQPNLEGGGNSANY